MCEHGLDDLEAYLRWAVIIVITRIVLGKWQLFFLFF